MQIYVLEGLAILACRPRARPAARRDRHRAARADAAVRRTSAAAPTSACASPGGVPLGARGAAPRLRHPALARLPGDAQHRRAAAHRQSRGRRSRPPSRATTSTSCSLASGRILLYQLDRRGSLVDQDLFGEQSIDPVVLLTPAFFILTVGIVFLRLFPLVLQAACVGGGASAGRGRAHRHVAAGAQPGALLAPRPCSSCWRRRSACSPPASAPRSTAATQDRAAYESGAQRPP